MPDSGTMPLIAVSVLSMSIGDIKIQRSRPSKGSEWVREAIYKFFSKWLEKYFSSQVPICSCLLDCKHELIWFMFTVYSRVEMRIWIATK